MSVASSITELSCLADAYRLALINGAVSIRDIANWADSLILIAKEKEDILQLTEISLSNDNSTTLSALDRLANDKNKQKTARIILGLLYKAIKSGALSHKRVSKILFRMTIDGYVPNDKIKSEMMALEDQYDLAEQKVYGDLSDVVCSIDRFLESFADEVVTSS